MGADYAGDVSPQKAWRLLSEDPAAQLIDVRSDAEWRHVGLPRLAPLGKEVHLIAWQLFPKMGHNPDFAQEIAAKNFDPAQPLLFLCRSGVRSMHAAVALTGLGYQRCYNVAEGFEGDRDENGHRGNLGGWKHAGLPWDQA